MSDADCGAGYVYNSANAASECAGSACDISGTAADKTACCVAQATCGDKDGAGSGTATVSDADCGAGYVYNSANAASSCAGAACDVASVASDKAACCVAESGMQASRLVSCRLDFVCVLRYSYIVPCTTPLTTEPFYAPTIS